MSLWAIIPGETAEKRQEPPGAGFAAESAL